MIKKTILASLTGSAAILLSACSGSMAVGPEAHHHDVERHPACEDDVEGYAESVAMAVDMETGYTIDNVQIIDNEDRIWIGASVFDGEDMKSRSEVWLIDEGNVMWGISGDAGNYAGVPTSTEHIMLDEYPSGVDSCTIIESGLMDDHDHDH